MSVNVPLLPLFPLNLVPFEGEPINLHIFEDRYKDLVRDCLAGAAHFGIVPYISEQLCEYGGYMQITEIVKTYSDGRMDIRTLCVSRIRIIKLQNPAPGLTYAACQAEVMPADPAAPANPATHDALWVLVKRLYALLQSQLDSSKRDVTHLSYALGHKIGLSLDQEYELFLITSEQERQEYLIGHLQQALPSLEEFDRTRARIQLNGHFQKFDPLTF